MVSKVLFVLMTALIAFLTLRWFSQKPETSRVPISRRKNGPQKPKQLVWDEKSQSYRIQD